MKKKRQTNTTVTFVNITPFELEDLLEDLQNDDYPPARKENIEKLVRRSRWSDTECRYNKIIQEEDKNEIKELKKEIRKLKKKLKTN